MCIYILISPFPPKFGIPQNLTGSTFGRCVCLVGMLSMFSIPQKLLGSERMVVAIDCKGLGVFKLLILGGKGTFS